MASTINASSSGSGGLISTGDASGVLQLQSNGSIALAIDTSKRVGIGTSPANNNNPLQAYYSAAGNIASISITNTDTSSDYSHAGLYMESKNGAVYGSIFTDKANALLRLGYNTTGATLGINGSGNIASFGGQITFPATQSASSDANTLDDYEEGTWTPGFSFGGGTTGITYSAQYGTYTKIGNTVRVTAYVQMSNKGSSTGQMRVTGLPFTCNSNARGYAVQTAWLNNTVSALNGAIGCYVEPSSTSIYYEKMSGGFYGAFQQMNDTMVGNNTDTMINLTYQVA